MSQITQRTVFHAAPACAEKDPTSIRATLVTNITDGSHRINAKNSSSHTRTQKCCLTRRRHCYQWFRTKDKREQKERSQLYIFLIPASSMWSFFGVWLCGLMINEATHGKIVTFTMEGVVLAWSIAHWPASASHAHLEGPHGIQWLAFMEGGKTWLLNHYRLWNYSETAGNVQTDKPGSTAETGT